MSLKQKFNEDYCEKLKVRAIIVAVQLPTGSIEVISNWENLEEKYMYYLETYNKDMVMYKNENIKIVNWMIL